MVKHTHTICRQIANELFESVYPFFEIGAETVNSSWGVSLRNKTYITRRHLMCPMYIQGYFISFCILLIFYSLYQRMKQRQMVHLTINFNPSVFFCLLKCDWILFQEVKKYYLFDFFSIYGIVLCYSYQQIKKLLDMHETNETIKEERKCAVCVCR